MGDYFIMNCKTAVVLAAGAGTRMRSEKPKVLHEVCGKPMVSHVTSQAAEAGADNIIVVIGHGADRVKNAIDDGKLKFAVQSEQLLRFLVLDFYHLHRFPVGYVEHPSAEYLRRG